MSQRNMKRESGPRKTGEMRKTGKAGAGGGRGAQPARRPSPPRKTVAETRHETGDESRQKLQKVLQACGLDSRRSLRQQIHEGHIKVNNQVVTDPNFLVDTDKDTIRVDEKKLKIKREKTAYYIFHKPYGVVTTLDDPQGRPTIKEFTRGLKERVYPVGRLDYHSEGLILLTNDGELTNFIISPRNRIPKVYLVKIKGILTDAERAGLRSKGFYWEGSRVKPLQLDFVKKTAHNNSWIRVSVVEGKKHIIRNIFKYMGHPVEKLKRVAIGTFRLQKLPAGHVRNVTEDELELFKKTYRYGDSAR